MNGTFRALRHRDFRLLWTGLIVSAVGTWMQIVGQALLVLEISHGSAFALGAVSLAQATAFFAFALFGGAVADRVDKRRLLLATQTLCMLFATLLGVLTITHLVRVWMVVVLAFLQGTALSFDQPTRAAIIPDLVPKEDLLNAFSLQSIVFTGASTLGPALAGLALARIGYAGIFFANAVSYVAVLGALSMMRIPAVTKTPTRTPSFRAIKDALAAVRADVVLPSILILYAALLFFGPSPALLLPVMGTRELHLDPAHVGILFACSGAGSVLGGLVLASAGDPKRKTRIVLTASILWAIALTIFSSTRSFVPALVTLVLVGAFQVGVTATTITLMQTRVPREMSGRVMSLNTLLIMGARPLGDFFAASIIGALGAPMIAKMAAAVVFAVAIIVLARADVRMA